jgi:hypothetical protein
MVPRGGVLRCLVEDDENGQLVVGIDDNQLLWFRRKSFEALSC